MPRAVVGVQKMRVQPGDRVHILAHRIPFVAWRMHRFNERARVQLLDHLRSQDEAGKTYTVTSRTLTGLTGLVYIYDDAGERYSAHHSDLVRE